MVEAAEIAIAESAGGEISNLAGNFQVTQWLATTLQQYIEDTEVIRDTNDNLPLNTTSSSAGIRTDPKTISQEGTAPELAGSRASYRTII